MPRTILTDIYWNKLKKLLYQTGRIYNKAEHRMTMEGILYRMRTGCPWRDLPKKFGKWNTIYRRFLLWSRKGVTRQLFELMSKDNDSEWIFIDSSIVKAHQHSTGASRLSDEHIGKSVAGNTTKIHLAVDSFGLPVNFDITGGEVHDSKAAENLLNKLPKSEFIIADRGYDSQILRDIIKKRGSIPIIPRKRNSRIGNDDIDWHLYKLRHLVENAFARIKHYRAVSTRYDKLSMNYASVIALAFCMMWIKM